ncbi:MAG: S8 family serine peptidase [Planctomycetales bacterium]|nr:S8 family serine peptidase [Planctomycetales bacterium]
MSLYRQLFLKRSCLERYGKGPEFHLSDVGFCRLDVTELLQHSSCAPDESNLTAPSNNSRSLSLPASPIRASADILFETCEQRLVLSAQLLFDVLGDQLLDMHVAPIPDAQSSDTPLETHLQEAHAATGWDQVQQQFGLTGKGQTVAVIDSGIAWDHLALGKGYGPGYRVVGGWDFTEENDAQPYDDGPMGFHGTHVSGIIGSDDPTRSGVAPDVDFVALRVFNDVGQGQISWVEKALQWVHQNRDSFENPITTVNLSLGTTWNAEVVPSWATLEEELRDLFNDGIVVTASAGNSFQDYHAPGLSYPAASSYVLPVASVDDDGGLSDFSQRSQRAIAAPGNQIVSTVPDHVLGRDGIVNDFSTASGTSMAAPYVAGASVLVRQAMEMVGIADINLNTIADHLRETSDSVFDALTGKTYDRLNLESAIDSLIPVDTVADGVSGSTTLAMTTQHFDGWINTLDDVDAYRFTPDTSGTLQLDATSKWMDTVHWSIHSGATTLATGGQGLSSLHLQAGQSYELLVSSSSGIGTFSFDLDFAADSHSGGDAPNTKTPAVDLGSLRYQEMNTEAGNSYRVQAQGDGTFTIQWKNADDQHGQLVAVSEATTFSDSTWESSQLRIDLDVHAGQWIDFTLPGSPGESGELTLANVLNHRGTTVNVTGSEHSDELAIELNSNPRLVFGNVEYGLDGVHSLSIDAYGGNDSLNMIGSAQSDKVDLRPGQSIIENNNIHIDLMSTEDITYSGGGGPDRVYLYDSNQDDTLVARPGQAELVGVGYRFNVLSIDRIFVHATGGGQDYAYLYDSSGDDRLSVRPQFTSMNGDGFFNYVRGFERVYAYANAGGHDTASLYDSAADDRFTTSGASASIVGPGFSSFTRGFEQVQAYSNAGGTDLATLYGSSQQTSWQRGSDYVGFREGDYNREARGFQNIETFVGGHAVSTENVVRANWGPASAPVTNAVSTATYESGTSPQELAGRTDPVMPAATSISTEQLPTLNVRERLEHAPTDGFHGLNTQAPEGQLLNSTSALSDWLSEEMNPISRSMEKFHLPEELLLNDVELENLILDEVFRLHEERASF